MERFLNDRFCFGLALLAGVWLSPSEIRLNAQDANALIARAFETNRPWLNPKPARGSYSLSRLVEGASAPEITGPFLLEDPATNRWAGGLPYRVGSLVWTPLHVMANRESPFPVSWAGETSWNGLDVLAADVEFDSGVSCTVAMGGQGGVSYTHCDYGQIRSARILIAARVISVILN